MASNSHRNPLISVIMPVYNREAYLREAVGSILRQTYTDFELILADDGSTDRSRELIQEFARQDQRIRVALFSHKGLPATLNAVIPLAQGSLIAFMDSDDIAVPERLRVQAGWIRQNRLDLCGGQVETFGSETDSLGGKDGVSRLPESHGAIVRELLFRVPLWRNVLMVETRICREHPFNETMDCTDCEWPYRVVQRCVTGNVPQLLLKARRHGRNITTIKRAGHRVDATKSHFQYFYRLFPKTPVPDYIALCRIVDQVPMTSIEELERAGRWLVELARYPDRELQKRMARRWQAACDRSATLGHKVEAIYTHFARQLADIGIQQKEPAGGLS